MIFLPLGVIWLGYLLGWDGFAMIRGPGIGIVDLANPAAISKVQAWLSTPVGGVNTSSASPATVPAPEITGPDVSSSTAQSANPSSNAANGQTGRALGLSGGSTSTPASSTRTPAFSSLGLG